MDCSGKPTARRGRGLAAESPVFAGTPAKMRPKILYSPHFTPFPFFDSMFFV
jgi:hypothetical protein